MVRFLGETFALSEIHLIKDTDIPSTVANGYKEEEIVVLKDSMERATMPAMRTHILCALQTMVQRAKAGDHLFFHCESPSLLCPGGSLLVPSLDSGHGGHQHDVNYNKKDKKKLSECVYRDLSSVSTRVNVIVGIYPVDYAVKFPEVTMEFGGKKSHSKKGVHMLHPGGEIFDHVSSNCCAPIDFSHLTTIKEIHRIISQLVSGAQLTVSTTRVVI